MKNARDIMPKTRYCDILCFVETWMFNDFKLAPLWLQNYNIVSSKATKDFTKGRSKGGIIIALSKDLYEYKVLKKCDEFVIIFVSLTDSNLKFILVVVYFNPIGDIKSYLNNLYENVNDASILYPNSPIYIGGDYNARIGNLNTVDEDILIGTNVNNCERKSNDMFVNTRGRACIERLSNNGFIVLNGRSVSDRPAAYTYYGARGFSVIDLVVCDIANLNTVKDFKVLDIPTLSDHLPISLSIICTIKYIGNNNHNRNYVKWNKIHKQKYVSALVPLSLDINSSSIDIADYNLKYNIKTAADKAGMKKRTFTVSRTYKTPWFDKECQRLKRNIKKCIRKAKKSNFNEIDKSLILQSKSNYKKTISKKRSLYESKVTREFGNCRNSTEFWTVVNKYRNKYKSNTNEISRTIWQNYFTDQYPARSIFYVDLIDVRHPYLDADITLEEIDFSLNNCKLKKTPGSDGIQNEFFKNLSPNYRIFIKDFFNKILYEETIPLSWSELLVCMLHKKGNTKNPDNYRTISLVNSITKIFTFILYNRLTVWANHSKVLPESQSGFRKSRGCSDNIFILNAMINIRLCKPKQKLFTFFIDFIKAFDSVNHNLLWSKLFKLGVSSKIIRIIKNLYDKAVISIIGKDGITEKIELTQGVLQGEILSPLLFALFISDIDEFFYENNARGVSINHAKEIISIAYADDLILLSDCVQNLISKIKILEEYCRLNKLAVNKSKSKIMIFHKGKLKRLPIFIYEGESIEVAKEFSYLGITFSSSGLFNKNLQLKLNSSRAAIKAINYIIHACKSESWQSNNNLFKALSSSILLYSSENWGLRYLKEIDKFQTTFFKLLLNLPKYCPNYALKIETNCLPLSWSLLRNTLNWLNKIHSMEDYRLPKICLYKLVDISTKKNCTINSKYNWIMQLNEILETYKLFDNITILNLANFIESKETILEKYRLAIETVNWHRLEVTENMQIYKTVAFSSGLNTLLLQKFDLYSLRLLIQIRLLTNSLGRIWFEQTYHRFYLNENCEICYQPGSGGIMHFLADCPAFTSLRMKMISSIKLGKHKLEVNNSTNYRDVFIAVLSDCSYNNVKVFINYVRCAFKLREKILNHESC